MLKRLKNAERYKERYRQALNDYFRAVSDIRDEIKRLLYDLGQFKGEIYELYGSDTLRFLNDLEVYSGEWYKRIAVLYSSDDPPEHKGLDVLNCTYTPEYVAFVDGIRVSYPILMKLAMMLEDSDVDESKVIYAESLTEHRANLRQYFSKLTEYEDELVRKAYHWRAGQTDRFNRFAVKLKKADLLTDISDVVISLHEYNGPAYDYLIEEAGWGLNEVSFSCMENMTEDDDVDVFEDDKTDDIEFVF